MVGNGAKQARDGQYRKLIGANCKSVVLKDSGSSSRKKGRITPKDIGGFSLTLSFGTSKDGVSIAKATTLLALVHRPQWCRQPLQWLLLYQLRAANSGQAAGAGACAEPFGQGLLPWLLLESRETGHPPTACLEGAQLNFGLLYGDHEHSHKKNKRKHWRSQWAESSILSDMEMLKHSLEVNSFSADSNKTGNISEKKSHKRTKRFLSYPRFVEVMVVADSRMVAYHGANLQHYVLTLMSIVASIYKDPSIGNLINIVIVKLVVIHNEQVIQVIFFTFCLTVAFVDGPAISYNAQTTLKNFCQWQQSQNHPEGSHLQHDTAVLVTRQDICRAHDKCDTLGLAELGTVCDPYRSCSISEDNGLSTAFTIAHELGHVFNMPHDDNHKCKEDGGKNQQHVMAPTLNFYTNPWMWSKCSRKYITEFLDTGYGECLLDEPSSRTYTLPQQLPGLIYDVNKQCELIFGPGSQVCPYMHCRFGMCVPKEREAPVIDGAWGTWSPFGTCSRTCGGGIKTAIRECNRPEPKNGGKYCVGRRMKFKSCNTEPCSKLKKDFRDEQCADFDGKHFNINGLPTNVRWVPKYSGILMKDRCKLFCRVAGNTAYYQLRDRVIDGTPCGPDTNDICVQGLCRQAGCDHVLNSKARRDKCGVCGGDNSSCKTVAGTFNTVHYGYNVVVRIPAGATNIDVRQHSYSGKPEDDNYLALSNSQGDFILNGDFVVSMFKREIKVGNAVIEYSGSDNTIERINSTDRIEQEITLQVLSVGNLYNPDVRYTFNIPIEDKPQQFYWNAYGPWQPCSKLCQGERKRKPVCTRESDQLTVSDQRCDRIPQPDPITEPCSTECELRWHIARKSECTAQCGLGYRTLEIYCSKYSRLEGKIEKVDDRFCSSQPKPSTREKCTGDCNVGGWRYSAWTECSKSCGGGTRRRRAMCVNTYNDVLDDSKCSQQEKLTVQRCSDFSCPQWKTGDWSECLVTCGKGHKHRQTWCQFGEDRLNDRFCDPETKPESVQTCQQQECASWQVGPWGQCTTTCGQGYQMRAVKCVVGTYVSVVDDNECNAATRPTDTQDCEIAACPPHPNSPEAKRAISGIHRTQWRFGSWTPCSATCGKGTRMRYVSCRDDQGSVADESACFHLPKPSATEMCSVMPCGQWKALEWSSCSVTCGQGKATRQVICINYSDQLVDRSECDPDDLPATEQDCSMSPCHPNSHDYGRPIHPFLYPDHRLKLHPGGSPNRNRAHIPGGNQWRIGPWGACSSTCAGGFQRRVVVCQDENGYTANNCDEKSKPLEQRSCESGPCPQWAYGNWGECTKPCGAGTRTRLVVCQRPNGERFTDLSCEILDKPPDREQCNVQDCPRDAAWSAGPWSSISLSQQGNNKVMEGLKPWEFPNNKIMFGAEVSYTAPLPLEESATEMLFSSTFCWARSPGAARAEPCAKARALGRVWRAGNHGPAGFGVAFNQMSTFIVYFVIKASEENLKKKINLAQKHFIGKKKGLFVMYWTSLIVMVWKVILLKRNHTLVSAGAFSSADAFSNAPQYFYHTSESYAIAIKLLNWCLYGASPVQGTNYRLGVAANLCCPCRTICKNQRCGQSCVAFWCRSAFSLFTAVQERAPGLRLLFCVGNAGCSPVFWVWVGFFFRPGKIPLTLLSRINFGGLSLARPPGSRRDVGQTGRGQGHPALPAASPPGCPRGSQPPASRSFTQVAVKLVLQNTYKLKQRESEESNPQSSGEIPLGFYTNIIVLKVIYFVKYLSLLGIKSSSSNAMVV
ncbi:hypothetical protein QYF61_003243 [Mycteria americana]|uniref:Peptidase M12B domain-containing protein n=1 Tax=Mycteria americana TaxID=33587 RepID=A0AAN7MWR3_MYCAM|nr:hypothetical protein QYF61_003243 [Mycteria americana]